MGKIRIDFSWFIPHFLHPIPSLSKRGVLEGLGPHQPALPVRQQLRLGALTWPARIGDRAAAQGEKRRRPRRPNAMASIAAMPLPSPHLPLLLLLAGGAVPLFAEMVTARLSLVVPLELAAEMSTAKRPAAVGVPKMTPVTVLMDKPAGNPLAAKDVGALVAVIR
jgi:hypothetical protein